MRATCLYFILAVFVLQSSCTEVTEPGPETDSAWITKRYCSPYNASYVQHFYDRIVDQSKSGYLILLSTDNCGKCQYLEEVFESAMKKLDRTPGSNPPRCLVYKVFSRNEIFPRILETTQLPSIITVNGYKWCQTSNNVNYTVDNIEDLTLDPTSMQEEFIRCGKLPTRLPTVLDNLMEWYYGMMHEFKGMVQAIFDTTLAGGLLLALCILALGATFVYAIVQFRILFSDSGGDVELDAEFQLKIQPVLPYTPGSVTPARKQSGAQSPKPTTPTPSDPSQQDQTPTPSELLQIKKNK